MFSQLQPLNVRVDQFLIQSLSILQLSDDGTEVYRINATDADEGTNAIIIYSLDDRSGNLPFSIRDGIIVVDGRLDYETQTVYSVSSNMHLWTHQICNMNLWTHQICNMHLWTHQICKVLPFVCSWL